jgi:hypothetical protein
MTRQMHHVDVRYTITMRRGEPGFVFAAEAINKLQIIYGAFNFNLVLETQPRDVDQTAFEWEEGGRTRCLRLHEQFDSFFRLPSTAALTIVKPGYAVCIRCDPAKTAGFYTDWATSFLTPDIHGFYRQLAAGDRDTVQWQFTATTR